MIIKLYDADAYIRDVTNGEFKAFHKEQEFAIIPGDKKVLKVFFDASHIVFDSLDENTCLEVLYTDAEEENCKYSHDVRPTPLREIMEKAPCKEIKSCDFFHKRHATPHDQRKFLELLKALREIGVELN